MGFFRPSHVAAGGRCRAMAVPCSPMAASPLCRASMITSWSYAQMAHIQRVALSILARFLRCSNAVSTLRTLVSNAVPTSCTYESSANRTSLLRRPFVSAHFSPCCRIRVFKSGGTRTKRAPPGSIFRCVDAPAWLSRRGRYSACVAGRISNQQPSGSSMK